jgi:hypothetical protein
MKMGTTASPWRYDAAAHHALQPANLRRPAILHFASCADDQPSRSARCTQARTFMFNLDLHRCERRGSLRHGLEKGICATKPSPQDDRCPPQPGVGRQLIDHESSNICACDLAALCSGEVGEGSDVAKGPVISEHAGPDDHPIK